jgi:cytoskeletal protein CcmA (bactofilin family)
MSKANATHTNPTTHITQIKEASVIQGNMRSAHSIRVDGFVTGDLVSDEKIIVGHQGEIGGNLSGTDITVQGFISGDVIANGLLKVTKSAKIFGKISAKTISIEVGAELNGKVTVGQDIELPEFTESSPSRSSIKETRHESIIAENGDKYGNVAW